MEDVTVTEGQSHVVSDTKHEPHPHAVRRISIGVAAVVIVFVCGGIVWSFFGDTIERICFGLDDGCSVPTDTEDAGFAVPPDYTF